MLVSEVVCISGAKLSGAEHLVYSLYRIWDESKSTVHTGTMESHINFVSARAILWRKKIELNNLTQTVPKSGTGRDCVTGATVAGVTVAGVPMAGGLTSMGCPTDSACVELLPPVALRWVRNVTRLGSEEDRSLPNYTNDTNAHRLPNISTEYFCTWALF